MSEIKKKIIFYHFVLLGLFLISLITSISMIIVKKNWTYLYTTILNIPFMSASKLVFLAIDKEMNKRQTRDKRKSVRLKMVFLHMSSYFLLVMPFIVTNIVFFLFDSETNIPLIESAINSKYLNLWISIGFLFSSLLSWIIINITVSYIANKKIINKQEQSKENVLNHHKETSNPHL